MTLIERLLAFEKRMEQAWRNPYLEAAEEAHYAECRKLATEAADAIALQSTDAPCPACGHVAITRQTLA